MAELIKWEDRNSLNQLPLSKHVPNGIECPLCKKELYDNTEIVLTTYPPKVAVVCLGETCDFNGSR